MYVITGATGNTGTIIVQKLLKQGKPVRAVGRSAERLAKLKAAGAEAFVADVTSQEAITKAFAKAKAVYLMTPPNLTSSDYLGYQAQITENLAQAIEKNGVQYAVTLSSLGADKTEGTGPILGLRGLEERVNCISGLNALHLRPGYFMENTLTQAGIIPQLGATAGPLKADLKLPMIATRDIGEAAANALLKLDFSGRHTRELLGQRDLNYTEVTAIIGKAINKPDLRYQQLPPEQFRGALVQMGMSENFARLIVELSEGLNSGHIRALEPRSARNTTPTSYETFVADTFLPAYHEKLAVA
jgi:uncharacterized protein YbjT (DUF2867 family)